MQSIPLYPKLLKLTILLFLVWNAHHAWCELPDSMQVKLNAFIQVLESDLNDQAAKDSIWRMQAWDWSKVEQEDLDQVTELLNQRIDNAKTLSDEAVMRDMLRHVYQYSNQIGKAVVQYEKLIATHTVLEDTADVIRYYHWMGWMYHDAGLLEESVISFGKLVDYQESVYDTITGDIVGNYWTYGYLYGVAGWELNKPSYQDSAVKYMGMTYDFAKALDDNVNSEWTITYAMGLARQGEKEKAIEVANHGLKWANARQDKLYQARFHKQLSQYFMSLDMRDSAYHHLFRSAKYEDEMWPKDAPNVITLENGKGRLLDWNIGFLIALWQHFGEEQKALAMYDRILEGPDQLKNPDALIYYRKDGADAYFRDGQYQKAADNYRLFIAYQDSVNRAQKDISREVKKAQLETQIELEKERAEVEKRQQEELAQKEKENLRTIIYVASGFALVVIALLVLVYRRFKVTSKQKVLIEEQKGVVESAFTQLEKKNKQILSSINYAKRIQMAILPPDKLIKKHLPNSFVVYLPKDIVAGDFYWLETKDDKVLFAAADCTGHGVPGAMVSVICNNGLNRSVREHGITDPDKIFEKTREIVMTEFEKSEEEVNDGMDIGLVSMDKAFDPSTGQKNLKFAGAHNSLWLVRKGSNEIEEFRADRQPIGKFDHDQSFTCYETTVGEGDILYLYSDGFADQFGGERGKKYYPQNLKKFLLTIKDKPLEEQEKLIIDEFERWRGDREQIDDVSIIGVKI